MPSASISRILEGVEFSMGEEAHIVRVVVTRDLLENVFGASGSPDSWIHAYCVHRPRIHQAVEQIVLARGVRGPAQAVVLSEKQWREWESRRPK